MKISIYKAPGIIALIFFVFSSIAGAQVTRNRSSDETRPAEVIKTQDQINNLLSEAGTPFKEGLSYYESNRRSDAGAKFDKAVEVFLNSTLNVQREKRLQDCYNQLIE